MNIAFWSNVRCHGGVTSSVALVSVLWTQLFKEEIVVTSNHIGTKSLAKRLQGGCEYEERIDKKAYRYMVGEPEYFRMLYSGKVKTTLFLNDSLRYVSMENDKAELFYTEGLGGVKNRVAEQEYLLIDTACGYTLCSQKILEDAEVKVIIFPPDREYMDAFFQSGSRIKEECFYIIGNYRFEGACRPAYLCKRYNISRERIGIIPYNFGFEQAMLEGSTIAYIAQNLRCSRRNKEYRFMYYATETVVKLREYVISRRKMQCEDLEEA